MKILELAPLWVAPLLAAADVAPIGDIPLGVGSLSATALLGWYMYYDKRHAQPRREKAERETIEKIVKQHSEDSASQRADFKESLASVACKFTREG